MGIKRNSIASMTKEAEMEKIFIEKLRKASSNVREDFDTTIEKTLATLMYNYRLLCERGYFNKFSQEDYIDYLEKEIICLKLLKESVVDNEGIL